MNTALQCLSNCWELTCYLLKNYYKNDINLVNPIGTKGIQARAYANLVKNLWYGEKNYYAPLNFKRVISKFQPTFAGYTQHDTQEFLNSLLDGLHEDLNRVLKKPLVPKDESKKPDNVKSLEQWYSFLLRNQSLIVDLFYGQYKSILYCPNEKCQNISTTFEPFLSLTLPLTNKTVPYEIICFFIFYDISITPIQLNLQFSSECTIMAFRNKLAKILNLNPFSFFIVKMDSGGNYDHLVSSTSLLKINNYYTNSNQRPFFLFQIDPNLFYTTGNKFYNLNFSKTPTFIINSLKISTDEPDIENIIPITKYENRDFFDTYETLQKNAESFNYLFNEDYEEDESKNTVEGSDSYYSKINIISRGEPALGVMKINTDENHGFDNDYLRLVIHLTYYNLEKSEGDNIIRDRIIFPRIIYVNSDWTLDNLYNVLIEYFLPKLYKKNTDRKNSSPKKSTITSSSNTSTYKNLFNDIFKKYFSYLDTEKDYNLCDMQQMHINDFYEFQKKNNLAFRVRIKNIMISKNQPCIFCGKIDCSGCLLPASRKIKIMDIIAKYPKSDTGLNIDNTYLYLADYQREHHGKWNRDFSIELSWLPEFKSELYKLNDKVDSDFKIQRSEVSKGISIYECFKKFVKLEKLEEKNEWFCSNCKSHQCATKKMEIYKSPHILVIHLKRFKNLNKLERLVDFPIVELDISQFVVNKNEFLPMTYDLFAVSNHLGSTDFGHYFSFAKNPFDNQWYKFDDANVIPIPQNDIVSSSAYVLFYRRKNLENLIDLQELYKKSFVNYEPLIQSVEENLQLISQISSGSFDSD
jgi:ubiquitin C-terminal hydrolase